MSDSTSKKILYISHGHPDINPGGGEIAAYNLFSEIRAMPGFDACFFARHDKPGRNHGGTTFAGTGAPNEILFYVPMGDWFKFSQIDKPKIWRDFREVLENYNPDIVHFHHYVHLGLEMIREVKNFRADLPVVLTLHEYFGICHNHGQMVKTTDNSLCKKSSPTDCAGCFPKYTPQDFFLRKQFIQSYFTLVDQFISPSEFLRDRYADWGIPSGKIKVIENIDLDENDASQANGEVSAVPGSDTASATLQRPSDDNSRIRFSFFGQINWFKGIDVLLETINLLPAKIQKKIVININGSGLDQQPEDFRKYVKSMIERSAGTIRLKGRYAREELPGLMNDSDWVVMPSKWWENSPVVILEAKKYGVPVLCSNIGGMAEKVEHGVTGLHFQVGRADSLADQIEWIVRNRDLWSEFPGNIKQTYNSNSDFDEHVEVYSSLLAARDSSGESVPADEPGLRAA